MLVGRRLIVPRKQRHQASGVVVLVRRHRPKRILLDRQPALVVIGFEVFSTVRINALHQTCTIIVDIDFLAAIGVMHRDTAVIGPGIARIHLRKAGPMANTPRRLARSFPFPKETRATGQPTLKNDVLLVVPINLAFTYSIGRRNQSPKVVIGVGNNLLLGHPCKRFMPLGAMNLIVHRHNAAQLVPQKQRAPHTVIQPLNPPQTIVKNSQPVVIRIADGNQHAIVEVIKPRRLSQHQLIRQFTQINRRFSQAIGNRRSSSGRQHKLSAAIFMIGPHHRLTGNTKPVRQRMTPAKPQPAIHFHRAGAIHPLPLKRQNSVQRAISEGQQFLAGDHRHRATIGNGFVRRGRRIAIEVLTRSRNIIHRLFLLQHRLLPRPPAHLQRALLQPANHTANCHRLVTVHRLHECGQNPEQAPDKTHRGLQHPRAVFGQPQAEISHARRRQRDGQYCADHQINQQRHYKPCRCLRDFAGWQRVQPQHRGAQYQVQRGLIAGQ
ncbi:hypothetical protein [Pseudomonas sp. 58 R 3]|nr:hypothetical protein [Pseudomonas sp. 58 R 3]